MPKIYYKKLWLILFFVFMFGSGCTILSFLQGQGSSTSEQEAFERTRDYIETQNAIYLTQISASATAAVGNATATAQQSDFEQTRDAIIHENETRAVLLTATAEAEQGE